MRLYVSAPFRYFSYKYRATVRNMLTVQWKKTRGLPKWQSSQVFPYSVVRLSEHGEQDTCSNS